MDTEDFCAELPCQFRLASGFVFEPRRLGFRRSGRSAFLTFSAPCSICGGACVEIAEVGYENRPSVFGLLVPLARLMLDWLQSDLCWPNALKVASTAEEEQADAWRFLLMRMTYVLTSRAWTWTRELVRARRRRRNKEQQSQPRKYELGMNSATSLSPKTTRTKSKTMLSFLPFVAHTSCVLQGSSAQLFVGARSQCGDGILCS